MVIIEDADTIGCCYSRTPHQRPTQRAVLTLSALGSLVVLWQGLAPNNSCSHNGKYMYGDKDLFINHLSAMVVHMASFLNIKYV